MALAAAVAGLAALAASDVVHAWVTEILQWSGELVAAYPGWGVALFVVLSALSAMLAFVSSAVVVPVAIHAWGEAATVVLLWLSWLLGGVAAYAVGRTLGRRVVRWLVEPELVDAFATKLSRRAGFFTILLFQVALPSEVPGYVLGTLRYRFPIYAITLSLAELPYAVGTVFLGQGFVEQNAWLILAVGALGLVAVTLAWLHLHRRLDGEERLASEAEPVPPARETASPSPAREGDGPRRNGWRFSWWPPRAGARRGPIRRGPLRAP